MGCAATLDRLHISLLDWLLVSPSLCIKKRPVGCIFNYMAVVSIEQTDWGIS